MSGLIRRTLGERQQDSFVESPSRANKTSVEVVVANYAQIGGGSSSNLETRNAGETISALKCIYSVSANTIQIAKNDIDFQSASVFGISITAANINESTQVQTFGTLRDSSFNWPANTQLYLDENGSLTDVAPTIGFRTLVATSQGVGQIYINIQEPITL